MSDSSASPIRAPRRAGGSGLKAGRLSFACSAEISLLHFGQTWLESKLMYPHFGHLIPLLLGYIKWHGDEDMGQMKKIDLFK
jgi:hypothetical protein